MPQPLGDVLQQQVADPVAERVVDDLEAVEVEEQDGEVRVAGPTGCRMPAELIERRTEDAPVRQAGQRIFRRQPRHMGLGLAPLGDVGKGLHQAAIGQPSAANLDHGAVRHRAFGDGELHRSGTVSELRR